jgi:hypothetical protein
MLVLAPKLGRHLLAKEERPEPGIPEWFIKSHPDYTGHLGPRTDWEVCDSFSKMIKFLLLTTWACFLVVAQFACSEIRWYGRVIVPIVAINAGLIAGLILLI